MYLEYLKIPFLRSGMILEHINSFKPGVPFMGHRQTN